MIEESPLVAPAPWPWRLPIVRHVRAIWYAWRVGQWKRSWLSIGFVPQDFDGRVIGQMWRGIV